MLLFSCKLVVALGRMLFNLCLMHEKTFSIGFKSGEHDMTSTFNESKYVFI